MARDNKPRRRGPAMSDDSSKTCFDFKRHGTCKFGDRCRYSHDVPARQDKAFATPGQSSTHKPQQAHEGKLREWKRLLLEQGSQPSRPSPSVVSRFFQLGLELMDGDVGAAQEAIKLLVSESGLSFIKDVSERHIQAAHNDAPSTNLWTTEVKPLFELVTHPSVVDSAVLEQEVAAIFNFLLGVGGSRMTRLFTYIVQLVQSWPAAATTTRMETVELSLAVLSKILDCNTANIVNENFSNFVTRFSGFLDEESQPEENFSRLQASKYLDYMRRRLEIGDEIAAWQSLPQVAVPREHFVLRRDLPGRLSAEGPRHDNDHAEIQDIKILPTYEEIMSPRGEYLPTNDSSQWHIQGIRGRLDREFRLVREDTVGQLRDAVREMLEHIRAVAAGDGQSRRFENSVRTCTYDYPTPTDIEMDRNSGLVLVVRCNQPSAVQRLNTKQRENWWLEGKRLQAGALVCIMDATGSVLFCVVSNMTMRNKDDRKARKTTDQKEESSDSATIPESLTLSDDKDFLYVKLQLIDAEKREVIHALRWYRNVGSSPRRYLVEFPGVLLDSFKHTLAALQHMYKRPNIPFSDLLAPSGDSSESPPTVEIEPALYARKAGFTFDLKCLSHEETEFAVSAQSPPDPEQLASRSTLDLTQSTALLNTLSRQLSLIQGPPGTGKSYTGERIVKVLLANKENANLGPILCVCYTNHALDQLLEHLLDDGMKSIIRIGSRSKSERLQGLNLRTVAQGSERTRSEKSSLYHEEETIRNVVREIEALLNELLGSGSWRAVKNFLANTYPDQHQELFGNTDDESWSTVTYRPGNIIHRWFTGGSRSETHHRQLDDLKDARLSSMSHIERRALHTHWLRSIRDPIIARIVKLHQEYMQAIEQRDRVRRDVDLRCLLEADIVGVTTTGLARNLDILRRLRCKVLLCEEAGEVLEAHILTALLPSVEQAILIGDHLQLRPQIQNYELQSTNPRGKQYSLDMSLFERLVQPPHETDPQVPFSILETQRRMHPSIAELIRMSLYPSLKDAETVMQYPKVVGMKQRLFWFQHEQLEAAAASNDPLSTSHSNDFEIEMTASLVSHLVRQGEYSQGDIAVLTPYLGQLHKLRSRMESMFEICVNDRDLEGLEALEDDSRGSRLPPGPPLRKTTLLKSVRVATVDNFQGEEAKVIVISLVRSNPQNRCGFLSTSNRINVLLSRAKHGMYIIGNSNTYQNVPMWANIINMLQEKGHFGTELELQCPRHPDVQLLVSEPDNFLQYSPESGCILPCDKRLRCGHSCVGRCHSDVLHNAVKCLENCPRLKKGCDHACPLRCGDPCQEKCHVLLENIDLALLCGHRVSSARCWEAQKPASIRCIVQVTRTVPGCNHEVKVRCHEDVTTANYLCTADCGLHRDCGHTCKSPCFRCNVREDGKVTKENHGICQLKCGRNYSTCRHSCSKTCHGESKCPPCNELCDVRCSHSRCSKPCHEPCAPCAEKNCQSSCPHTQCTMPCAAPCDWVPCSRRCEKILGCGHQCPSLCGEACPESIYCQQCGSEEIQSTCVDFLEMKEYHEIDLDEGACIFPDCGHFLTVSSMDGQMGMASHYELDENGLPIKITRLSEPFSMDDSGIRVCAKCRGSLRNISRYGRIVRRAMLDEATKKFIAWSNSKYLSLADRLLVEQEKLEKAPATKVVLSPEKSNRLGIPGSRRNYLRTFQGIVGKGRYDSIVKLWVNISSYANEVRKEEQPFQRVADLVQFANRQHRTKKEFRYDESVIQVKGYLLAAALLLKCDLMVISDFIELCKGMEFSMDLSTHWVDCANLIKLAQSSMHPREEVQGHIFSAQLCGLCASVRSCTLLVRTSTDSPEKGASDRLRETGLNHVTQARALLEKYPSVVILKDEIDAAEKMLNEAIYRPVTAEELRVVYMAMARELRGTGHWYTCQNGHPFTIDRCGMPMEEARCPECGAPIGGHDHVAVQGVRRADEIEELARDMDGLDM